MKTLILLLLMITSFQLKSQILLESTDGFSILDNPYSMKNDNILGAINLTEQSLQFRSYFGFDKDSNVPQKYLILGIKAKPSDGLATLFSNNTFNAGISINATYFKAYLLTDSDDSGYDFLNIKYNFSKNKYTLINKDTVFNNQINNIDFEGSEFSIIYNYFFGGGNLISFGLGYSRINNYSKLETQELRQINIRVDSVSNTIYEYGKTVNGRIGNYRETDVFPIKIGYTNLPNENKGEETNLIFGFSIYYLSDFGKYTPTHNIGGIIFLTKQSESTGIRVPVLGIGLQATDITDNLNKGNSLSQRLTFTLTSVFNIGFLK